LLRAAYNVFMFGLVLAVITFVLSSMHHINISAPAIQTIQLG
jgi:hypothetical protein